jgi:hypothetical protein
MANLKIIIDVHEQGTSKVNMYENVQSVVDLVEIFKDIMHDLTFGPYHYKSVGEAFLDEYADIKGAMKDE